MPALPVLIIRGLLNAYVPSFGQSGRKPKVESSSGFKSIEIRTSKGDAIRIQGELSAQELYSIIQASNHV